MLVCRISKYLLQQIKFVSSAKKCKYLVRYIASTEHDKNVRIGKAWSALNQLTNIWKSRLSKNLKRNFFRSTVESVLVYGAITWTLTSTLQKKVPTCVCYETS